MSDETLILPSHAKINLTLDVFNKRADGYHGVASVMQTISLADTLKFSRRKARGVGLSCPDSSVVGVPVDATNLAIRGAIAVLEAAMEGGAHVEGGVDIELIKCIPAQAGLGGGSSNAAAALLGVNLLLELGMDAPTLYRLAGALGSDVPFFLSGGTAVARGRGENIGALPDGPPFWMVVVKPEEGVSTAWAYQALDSVPERASHRATKRMEEALRSGDNERVIAGQSNDFELPVFEHLPKIAWLHDELLMAGARSAHLCGSGSAVYGIADEEAAAERIAKHFRSRYPHVAVARTATRAEAGLLVGTSTLDANK